MASNVLASYRLLNDADMSSDIQSGAIPIKYQDNIGIQLVWTGTPTGEFFVDISNNHQESLTGAVVVEGDWVEIPLDPTILASGSADSAFIDVNQTSAVFMRVRYVRSGGSGSLSCYVSAKGI